MMELKEVARLYAEAIIHRDITILRDIFAEHVRLFYNGQYIEGASDVLAHIQWEFNTAATWKDTDNVQISLMNIYQDSNTVIVEFQITRSSKLKPMKISGQLIEIIKFDCEQIVNIHGYYLDCDMSEETLEMHNALKTTS